MPGVGALPQRRIPCPTFAATRSVLERVISQRLKAQTNVTIRRGVAALGVSTAPDGSRATGVRVDDENGEAKDIRADLVVDASGRIGLIARALEAMGRPTPRGEAIGIDIGYTTGVFRIPNDAEPHVGEGFVAPRAETLLRASASFSRLDRGDAVRQASRRLAI
ncbi:NAD(P)/FAD-dependent oxidoreductase [Hansschlegelia beijingensis]|uniref:2-polyprenyl-6-methoxyphenol hydroxylase-like FAD-dependent oxidoreductase n=1 Tax=Hansschlegelia beijingensis TaxID=1133344 RepID=A0A7W6GEG3_9HYPH|nr:hypothetical protein [Hansschlegelia beijingensis]MBB3971867.1 2-polyprenyl-6-methoxyphenol hydroxylase-like FAD-dependent oxidoreductase [Hansschlegelia beijingensis]